MRQYTFLHASRLEELQDSVNQFIVENSKFDPQYVDFKVNEDRGWEEYYAVMSKTSSAVRRPQSPGPSA
jgi:hypothetical protein